MDMLTQETAAPVNRVIPFSSVDGPGNRTAVFLQGCSLNCLYCHNPETRNLCRACGQCVSVCPGGALQVQTVFGLRQTVFDPERCIDCGACQLTCRYGASPRVRWLTAAEVWPLVERQKPFISGLTVSGGECMLWPEFVEELASLASAHGLDVLLDSNGTVHFQDYPQLLETISGVMLDIKAVNDKEHQRLTGSSNQTVLRNAVFLHASGKLAEVRMVIVPDLFDVHANVKQLADFLVPLYVKRRFRVKLIAFRPQGVRSPYDKLQAPGAALMRKLVDIASAQGLEAVSVL